MGHRATRSEHRADRFLPRARWTDRLPLLETGRSQGRVVASAGHRDRRTAAPLTAPEDDPDDEESEQNGGDRQPDDSQQPAGPGSILALVASRLAPNRPKRIATEHDGEHSGRDGNQRHPEKD